METERRNRETEEKKNDSRVKSCEIPIGDGSEKKDEMKNKAAEGAGGKDAEGAETSEKKADARDTGKPEEHTADHAEQAEASDKKDGAEKESAGEAAAKAAAAAASILEEEEEKEEAEKAAEKKKDPKDAKIEELEDRLKRQLAEFDNFRKRSEREKTQMFDLGAKSILEKLLPTIDNFERSLASAPEVPEAKSYVDGMQMVYKQFMKNLEEAGVKPIDAQGKPFDPNFHNAVMHVDDESLGENVVAEELQKGYLYKDTVLRHSMVKVAN